MHPPKWGKGHRPTRETRSSRGGLDCHGDPGRGHAVITNCEHRSPQSGRRRRSGGSARPASTSWAVPVGQRWTRSVMCPDTAATAQWKSSTMTAEPAVTLIWAMLPTPSGPDTGRMAGRYGIAVVDDPAGSDADGRAWPGAPRFALAKFRPATLPATLVARPMLHDQLTAGAGRRLTVVAGVGCRHRDPRCRRGVGSSRWADTRATSTEVR
jgi:hypothetical protein